MAKYLLIAGHGMKPNGAFDPGATGIVGGEHLYMKNKLFPAMKKYANDDFIFFSDYKVVDKGNIVNLANQYGKDTKVIEFHYDSASNKLAKGGHVIIHADYTPDAMDLRLRDAIKEMLGLRYIHKGHAGFSGRSDLGNVNRTKKANVNYRLLELGFGSGTDNSNTLLNETDKLAKLLVEAITGTEIINKPKEDTIMNKNVPQWQKDAFKTLIEKEIIKTPEAWENKLDKQITVGEVMGILANIV